jgi:large subunit ribosomal protein L17
MPPQARQRKEDMAEYRKLGKKTKLRRALLRNQATQLIYKGRIITTEARAKEVQRVVEPLIALAAKEKDNFEEVTVQAKTPKKDANGKRVKEVVDGKKKTVYETVEKKITKDSPSRLHARRQMLKVLYPVVEVPAGAKATKKNTKKVDLVAKMFNEYGKKYADRKGGYTRIVKIAQRKGDAALMVVLELV